MTPEFDEQTRRAIAERLNTLGRFKIDGFDCLCKSKDGYLMYAGDIAAALGIGLDNIGFIEKGA